MQKTHYCNGPGLPAYPEHVDVATVNVWLHDSGMAATHDYACPVCRDKHAVLNLSVGLMEPCDRCQDLGYRLIKKDLRPWWKRLLW